MAITETNINVDAKVNINLEDEKVVVNVQEDIVKVNVDEKKDSVYINDKWIILPTYSYRKTDYTIPDEALGEIYYDIDVLRADMLDALAGQEVAIIDQVTYALTNENGILTARLNDLDALYLSTGDADKYVLHTELTSLAVAQEFLIDVWTGGYIQDRTDWDVEFTHTDSLTYTNDSYLEARWAQPDQVSADANFPLDGLNGDLIFDDVTGARVYRSNTTITFQDIYDTVIRVDNNYASYTSDLIIFADNQTAYTQRLDTLEASLGDESIKLSTFSAVFGGVFKTWNEIDDPIIGQVTDIAGVQHIYLGGGQGPNNDGWFPYPDTTMGFAGAASQLLTSPDGSITGWTFADATGIPSNFKIFAENFEISNGEVGDTAYTPFRIEGDQIYFDGVVDFSNIDNPPDPVDPTSPQEVVTAINNAQTTTIDGPRISTGSITADEIAGYSITANKILTYNLTSTNATIANAFVDTLHIGPDMVTVPDAATSYYSSYAMVGNNTWRDVATVSINLDIYSRIYVSCTTTQSKYNSTVYTGIRMLSTDYWNSSYVVRGATIYTNSGVINMHNQYSEMFLGNATTGLVNFKLQWFGGSYGGIDCELHFGSIFIIGTKR